jgi:hypothetical protein
MEGGGHGLFRHLGPIAAFWIPSQHQVLLNMSGYSCFMSITYLLLTGGTHKRVTVLLDT